MRGVELFRIGIVREGPLAPRNTQFRKQSAVLRKLPQHSDKRGCLWRHQYTIGKPGCLVCHALLTRDHLRNPTDGSRNERPRGCHSLDQRNGCAFVKRSLNHDVGAVQHARRIMLPRQVFDPTTRALHQAFDRRALRAIPHNHKAASRYGLHSLLRYLNQ